MHPRYEVRVNTLGLSHGGMIRAVISSSRGRYLGRAVHAPSYQAGDVRAKAKDKPGGETGPAKVKLVEHREHVVHSRLIAGKPVVRASLFGSFVVHTSCIGRVPAELKSIEVMAGHAGGQLFQFRGDADIVRSRRNADRAEVLRQLSEARRKVASRFV